MLRVFDFIRKYSFLLIIAWMVMYAVDLIDELQHNYSGRPSSEVAWMLFLDFIRCLLVMAIWVACHYDRNRN